MDHNKKISANHTSGGKIYILPMQIIKIKCNKCKRYMAWIHFSWKQDLFVKHYAPGRNKV
jgi:hypothetical protein